MAATLLLLLVGTAVSTAAVKLEYCSNHMLYKSLNCSAVMDPNNTEACPQYYKCPHRHRKSNKCYFRGRTYKIGEELGLVDGLHCSKLCTCRQDKKIAHFACPRVDCPRHFMPHPKQPEGQTCVYKYTGKDRCCEGVVCEKNENAHKLAEPPKATCKVGNNTKREGDQVYNVPGEPCKYCSCGADGNVSCSGLLGCNIELHSQEQLALNCAPAYESSDPCSCPGKFVCPEKHQKIIKTKVKPPVRKICRFGKKKLRVGYQIRVRDKCLKCACEIPPLATCKQIPNCKKVQQKN